MSDPFKDFVLTIFKKISQKLLRSETKNKVPAKATPSITKTHPWRMCAVGEHWVNTHPMNTPSGKLTLRSGHCRTNPKRGKKIFQDYLTQDEMGQIAELYFKDLIGAPTSDDLDFPNGNEYDFLIRGWTKYWNEIFNPQEPLDPNLVKALIASESGFNLSPEPQKAGSAGYARGLLQLTDQTLKALGDTKGELKNHLVEISTKEASNANISTSAGIRWLFHKQRMASNRLKREATWFEAIAEYKAYLKDMISGKNPNPKGMQNLKRNYERLKK